jgi:flagellar hook-associated protein 3 FlgL
MILRLNSALGRNEQYQKNIVDGQGFLETSGSTLDSITSLVQQAQQIVVESKDGPDTTSLSALKNQVDEIISEAVSQANAKFNGKFIFGGTETSTAPYVLTENAGPPPTTTVAFQGNANTVHYATGDGMTQQVGVSGAEAFGGTALFDVMIRIRDSLASGNVPSAADTATLDTLAQTVTESGSKVGSLIQGLDNTTTHLTDQKTQLQNLLSSQKDTDVAEATLNLKQEETMLNAALNVGAQILPKSLMDYLT